MKELSSKEERFCQEYMVELNAARAAIPTDNYKKSAKLIEIEVSGKVLKRITEFTPISFFKVAKKASSCLNYQLHAIPSPFADNSAPPGQELSGFSHTDPPLLQQKRKNYTNG